MQASLPFFEDVNEALKAAVAALGGAKVVGQLIWPSLDVIPARGKLLDCLNTERPAKLELEELMRLFKLAREVGCHEPLQWFCGECGYAATPVSAAAQIDVLAADVRRCAEYLAKAVPLLEKIQKK
jgi:hypothetical protein